MKRIFFVEDDLSLINGLTFAMKKQGYEVEVAHTSLEADTLWADGKYDLVILDVSLPDGSGFDICKKIRQISKVPINGITIHLLMLMYGKEASNKKQEIDS